MNIFYLHKNADQCAKMHCDKHVVKMILESAQLLCTAHRVCDGDNYCNDYNLYKKTHEKHASAIWVRKSADNYQWLHELFFFLLIEYYARYGKIHKCTELYDALIKVPDNIGSEKFTKPPQCMPEEYKNENTITAYRDYYNAEKSRFAKWNYSETPTWFLPLSSPDYPSINEEI